MTAFESMTPAQIYPLMAPTFEELVARNRAEPTRDKAQMNDGAWLAARFLAAGTRRSRVYLSLLLVAARGAADGWHGIVVATENGEPTGDVLPVARWTPGHHLEAAKLRERLLALSALFVERTDGESITFAPGAAQNSEPR